MEQRSPSAQASENVYVPPQPVDATSRAVTAANNDTHTAQRQSHQAPSPSFGSPRAGKPNYLPKTSLLYLFCVGNLIIALVYLAFYEQASISRAHYDELKASLRPPWIPFRWLGSKGVDVTDLQWYYFIVVLPPTAPYLVAFLFISRRLRRYIASKPGAAPWSRDSATGTSVVSPKAPSAAVKEEGDAVLARFACSDNYSNSCKNASVPDVAGADKSGHEPLLPTIASTAALEDGSPHTHGCNSAASASSTATLRLRRDTAPLHVFHIFSGAFIAFCLSGPGFLFGLALMSLNFFCIAPLYKRWSFRACMAIMWITHIAVLFLNFHGDGYRFAWFGLSFLDHLWPVLIKWNVQYNMTILRMISFNSDLWEAALCGEERRQKAIQKHERSCIACAQIRDQNRQAAATLPFEAVSCYKCRTECCRSVPEFTFSAYLGYMFYLPLFMAGPLSSFNAYVSYMHYPQRSVTSKATWRYGLRWLAHAFVLATLMHYVHIMAMLFAPTPPAAAPASTTPANIALAQTTRVAEALAEAVTGSPLASTTLAPGPPVVDSMTFKQKSVLFFLILAFLWAKFDVIWRFFRFFALLDGFDPPEDMPRCFANTVNIQSFWRDWHASFNLWIVRYMYVPMGGSRLKFISIFPIFFFIAIWHDIELRLLYWALFICVGFLPEILITTFFASKTNKLVTRIKRRRLLWRSVRVFGAQLCLMELALANLVGFAIGTSGTEAGLRQLFSEISATYLLYAPFLFFCAATLAVQDRDQKAYEAAQLKLKYDLQ